MPDKSIDPNNPNFDAELSTLHHSLQDKFPDINLEEHGDDAGDEPDPDSEDEPDPDEEDDGDEDDALEHYIPDDIQNDPTPREERD